MVSVSIVFVSIISFYISLSKMWLGKRNRSTQRAEFEIIVSTKYRGACGPQQSFLQIPRVHGFGWKLWIALHFQPPAPQKTLLPILNVVLWHSQLVRGWPVLALVMYKAFINKVFISLVFLESWFLFLHIQKCFHVVWVIYFHLFLMVSLIQESLWRYIFSLYLRC